METATYDVVLMDAIAQAEGLAIKHPELHAVIYRRHEAQTGRARYFVLPSTDEAPEGAELVTTVSRKPPPVDCSSMSLKHAVRQVVDNLPIGVTLQDRAVIEFYPPRQYTANDERVFAYQFLSAEGRNVATWIPDVSLNGVMMQSGFDGRGRLWHEAHMKNIGRENIGRENIGWMIAAAKVVDLDPGDDCTERFVSGWRRAEASLRSGASPDDDGPAGADDETFNGFIGRMARERELRAPAAAPVSEASLPAPMRRSKP